MEVEEIAKVFISLSLSRIVQTPQIVVMRHLSNAVQALYVAIKAIEVKVSFLRG